MKTIWKFELETTDEQVVEMPLGTMILTVQVQVGGFNNLGYRIETPCLWGLVDDTKENEPRTIQIVGTGNPANHILFDKSKYIGSYQLAEGRFVGHVFEK